LRRRDGRATEPPRARAFSSRNVRIAPPTSSHVVAAAAVAAAEAAAVAAAVVVAAVAVAGAARRRGGEKRISIHLPGRGRAASIDEVYCIILLVGVSRNG